ncbi:PolC-type DNA polymerase III [Mangrovimonas sp. DI 80]|uniref:3'-5' exonuclease n=1 Tax=Mangrovimonas sp. DI 80 TaxID=1779330 RepID=UPI000976B14D|nr:3'-5' exonuclease [Mangrovimonas sp. DI 80]OMP30850.1 DNA polymerase III subunit epsilon [Mangrovimonas sp. DI 80]
MLSFFRRNKSKNTETPKSYYPDYWERYAALFDHEPELDLQTSRFVVLDTETTGFDYNIDRVLCIGAVEIVNRQINVSNTFETYIRQERFNEKTVEIHGILKHERIVTFSEDEAIQQFLAYVGNAIIVAHHARFDMTMINEMLKRKGLPVLKNKVLDTVNLYRATRIKSNFIQYDKPYTLDEIAENYILDVSDRHTAAGDALITALIFLKTTAILSNKKKLTLSKMFNL